MAHTEATIDRDHCAGDVSGVLGSEEGHYAGDFVGFGHAGEGDCGRDVSESVFPECCSHIGAYWPGATTFTVIDREPSSRASDRASPTSPAFEAA